MLLELVLSTTAHLLALRWSTSQERAIDGAEKHRKVQLISKA